MYEEAYIVPKQLWDRLKKKDENNYIEKFREKNEKSIKSQIENLKNIDISNNKDQFININSNVISKEYILSNISSKNRKIAENILDFLEKHKDLVSWNNEKEIIIQNNAIPKSNIIYTLQILVKDIIPSLIHIPAGVFEIYFKLKELEYDMTTIPFSTDNNMGVDSSLLPQTNKNYRPRKVTSIKMQKPKSIKMQKPKSRNEMITTDAFYGSKNRKGKLIPSSSFFLDRYSDKNDKKDIALNSNKNKTNISVSKKVKVKRLGQSHTMKTRSKKGKLHQIGESWQTLQDYYKNIS